MVSLGLESGWTSVAQSGFLITLVRRIGGEATSRTGVPRSGFHDWTYAGIAIRPITAQRLGVFDISLFRKSAPRRMRRWLKNLVAPIETELEKQASRSHSELLSVFATRERMTHGLLVAADNGERFVAVNEEGRRLLGIPESALGTQSSLRRLEPEPFQLKELMLETVERANADRRWVGSAEVPLPTAKTAFVVCLQPVISDDSVVGALIGSSGPQGERLTARVPPQASRLSHILGVRARRLVVLSPEAIRFAEAEGNIVWMTTDQGRLRAFARGLGALDEKVRGHGFLRVSRRCLVNLNRVGNRSELKGGLRACDGWLPEEVVHVSRRHAAEVRTILGL